MVASFLVDTYFQFERAAGPVVHVRGTRTENSEILSVAPSAVVGEL